MVISKRIPETGNGAGVTCITKSKTEYRISQNPTAQRHTIWKIVPGGFEKIATAASPIPLYQKIEELEQKTTKLVRNGSASIFS